MTAGLRPGRGLLRALLVWSALAVAAMAAPAPVAASLHQLWLIGGGALLLATTVAAILLLRPVTIAAQRDVPGALPLGEWTDVTLRFTSQRPGPVRVEVYDHHPSHAETERLPVSLVIPPGAEVRWTYRLRARRRGAATFARIETFEQGSFDLLRRRRWIGSSDAVRVLPNFRPILASGLAGTDAATRQLGMHLQRRRGEGLEFQELREYRHGDTSRQIDWKATARRGKLITRRYQDERNQQVVFLLDCGRRMHAQEDDLTHFDHVLDATLLVGYVAARQGDAIGVQAFAGDDRWLAPGRGQVAVHQLLETIHDLETTHESPDYAAAAARLMTRQRRRALVLLITNLRDEDTEEMMPALHMLRRDHLVLVASIREQVLGRMRDQPVRGHRSALEVGAAHHYLAARRQAHERVRSTGALVLDVDPPSLPMALAARYLAIKRAGLL